MWIASPSKVISGRKYEAKAAAAGILDQAKDKGTQIVQAAREEAARVIEQASVEAALDRWFTAAYAVRHPERVRKLVAN